MTEMRISYPHRDRAVEMLCELARCTRVDGSIDRQDRDLAEQAVDAITAHIRSKIGH